MGEGERKVNVSEEIIQKISPLLKEAINNDRIVKVEIWNELGNITDKRRIIFTRLVVEVNGEEVFEGYDESVVPAMWRASWSCSWLEELYKYILEDLYYYCYDTAMKLIGDWGVRSEELEIEGDGNIVFYKDGKNHHVFFCYTFTRENPPTYYHMTKFYKPSMYVFN